MLPNKKQNRIKVFQELYYFGARYYDPAIGRWLSVDPLAGKYPSYSPYNYVLNNPISSFDPDGRDVIILNDASGAAYQGHNAVLVGSDKNGWTYYSKDGPGENNYTKTTHNSLEDFAGTDEAARYDEGVWFETTEEQDNAANEFAAEDVETDYSLTSDNCADLTRETANAAGVEITDDKVAGITHPNKQTKKAKKTSGAKVINVKVIVKAKQKEKEEKTGTNN